MNLIHAMFLIAFVVAAATHAADAPPLNEKVIAFCKANLDKTVGSGECAALAGQALKAAGAKIRAGPDSPRERDYVWGRQVYKIETAGGLKETGSLNDVRPGDIMQFRDVNFGGTGGFAHHTAVVAEVVSPESKKIKVFQQNAGGKRFVFETGMHKLQDMKEGYILIYRPLPADR